MLWAKYNKLKRRKGFTLKKLIALILTVIFAFTMLSLTASAFFGYGAAVVAADVKMIKSGLAGHKITFTDGDFKSALCISDFDAVTITRIPTSLEGTLLIGGRRVSAGKEIKRKNLGGLIFVPASKSVTECSFGFSVDGGAEIDCVIKFTDKLNYAPDTDSHPTVKTQEDITVYSQLSAKDPEEDILEYIVISYPKYGRVCMLEEGEFSYTPNKGFVGEDKFSYVVRDSFGNYSLPATVKLETANRMCTVEYKDMEERAEYNAAVAMTAMGIMGGEIIGDDVYFNPDKEVSRAEFVTLAMKASGIRADSTIAESYFDDNDQIPKSLLPYVATAQRIGLINGEFNGKELIFSPNEKITRYEAANLLAVILGVGEGAEESVFATDDEIPVWARQGVYAMCYLGVFDTEDTVNASSPVTRASAAEYLYRMSGINK